VLNALNRMASEWLDNCCSCRIDSMIVDRNRSPCKSDLGAMLDGNTGDGGRGDAGYFDIVLGLG
jgi:hypothetical protein